MFKYYGRYLGKIIKVVSETPSVKSFYVDISTNIDSRPGQYMMIWIPGYEEIPLSISLKEGSILRFTVLAVGETTKAMHRLSTGDKLIIRGPYGNGFNLNFNKVIAIAGGVGAAPIIYAFHELKSKYANKLTYVIGAYSAKDVLFLDEAKALGIDIIVTTEDGSLGYKGMVTDILDMINFNEYDSAIVCGPEIMMWKIFRYFIDNDISINAQFLLERYIKCGIGICGSCELDGYRVCKDGPVFTLDQLKNTSFGKFRRDPSGKLIEVLK